MRSKKMLVIGVLLVLCFGASLVHAFGIKPDPGSPQPKKMMERLAKKLSLTKEQQNNFMAQEKLIQEKDQQLRKENDKIMDKIRQEIKKDQPDQKLIKNYIDEIGQNQNQIHLRRIENLIQFRKQLTAGQKKKFDEMKPKFESKRGSKHKQK